MSCSLIIICNLKLFWNHILAQQFPDKFYSYSRQICEDCKSLTICSCRNIRVCGFSACKSELLNVTSNHCASVFWQPQAIRSSQCSHVCRGCLLFTFYFLKIKWSIPRLFSTIFFLPLYEWSPVYEWYLSGTFHSNIQVFFRNFRIFVVFNLVIFSH